VSLLVFIVVGAVGFLVSRSIVKQLGGEPATAIDLMSRAAEGDLTVEVHSPYKGSILDSAGVMVRSIRNMVTEISQDSTRLTQGTERISAASRDVALASQKQLMRPSQLPPRLKKWQSAFITFPTAQKISKKIP